MNVSRCSQRRSLTALGQKRKLGVGNGVSGGKERLAFPAHSLLAVSPLSTSQQFFLASWVGHARGQAPLHPQPHCSLLLSSGLYPKWVPRGRQAKLHIPSASMVNSTVFLLPGPCSEGTPYKPRVHSPGGLDITAQKLCQGTWCHSLAHPFCTY